MPDDHTDSDPDGRENGLHTEHMPGTEASYGEEETDAFVHQWASVPVVQESADSCKERKRKKPGIITRIKTDVLYRTKLIHSTWLFWAFICLGWIVGQMGPSFPDLMLIVDQELDTASLLFTFFSVGYVVGSLVSGALYDKYNKILLIFASVFGMSASSFAMPWSSVFPVMILFRFFCGMFCGGLDTGGNADMVLIWGDEVRPYMQMMHFCFAFGGILSPLATEPFLAKRTFETLVSTKNVSVAADDFNMTAEPITAKMFINTSFLYSPTTEASSLLYNSTTMVEVTGETRVQFAYIITGFIGLSAAIPFLVLFFQSRKKKSAHHQNENQEDTMKRPESLPLVFKVILLFLLSFMMLAYCAVEDTCSGFFMTFALKHLKWTKSTGSLGTALFWAAFACGRFSGIFLVWYFKSVNMLCAFLISLMSSLFGLLLSSMFLFTPLIWVFMALSGYSMSIVFPCIFTWTEERILHVTGKISAMFLLSASGGLMLNPLFLGYLMENFTPMWYIYLLFGESILCFLLYLCIRLITKLCLKPAPPKTIEIEIDIGEELQPLGNITLTSDNKK